ncbi:hypothetical protein ABC337_12855 [Arthrobacter sp. 1P04PC]|uniref:hypothetical protein n=1 Tax=unclassified Arthrobacter TaxID=235627 RepID=UPI0039A11C8D
MTSTDHQQTRKLQQDARVWPDFTGPNYTAALRRMTAPPTHGLLIHRVSTRRLTGKVAAVVLADVAWLAYA